MPKTLTTITAEELLQLRSAASELDALKSKLRLVTVERDLLQEKLKVFQHKLFSAKSEIRGSQQKDLFLKLWHPLPLRCLLRKILARLRFLATSAKSLVVSLWIRLFREFRFAMSYRSRNASVPMMGRR
ncbi:TPA: hypothetical protein ACU6E5_005974 [Pseudomonas aeruginosa]